MHMYMYMHVYSYMNVYVCRPTAVTPTMRLLMHLHLQQVSMMTTNGQGGSILTLMLFTLKWQVITRQ